MEITKLIHNVCKMEKEFNGKLLVDSKYLDRDDNGYLYCNGEPFTGLKGFFRKDDTLSSYIEYVNSIPHGKSEAWYESGQKKKECYYAKGCVVGISNEWYESGKLKKQVEEESPTNYILKEWYESGQLKKEFHMKNLETFMRKEWDESGNLIKEYNSKV